MYHGLSRMVAFSTGLSRGVALCWTLLAAQVAAASPLTWDMFSLPAGYGGEAIMERDGRDAQVIRFDVSRRWMRRNSFLIVDGLGESLIESRLGAEAESWTIDTRSSMAMRTNRFPENLQEAGEVVLSPIAALRPLIEREIGIETVPADLGEGWRRIRATVGGRVVELDLTGRDVAAYREFLEPDRMVYEVLYEDWRDLLSGARAPHATVSRSRDPATGDLGSTLYRIRIDRELPERSPPPEFVLPAGFTIVDHIEGVTKREDGTVIAPIVPGQAPEASEPGATPPQSVQTGVPGLGRLLIGIGVVVVLSAGLLAFRRKSR
ncbi:MAG: hypothetical protein JJU44_04260 [Planctomycetes bacterium]|nr:hypothetical protein [Planctomycetota bacterium]